MSDELRSVSPEARRGAAGFTLVELMIVVGIVALLAAIAYPAYTTSVIKGKRAEGRAALADLMQQQERYLTQTGSYMAFSAGATGNNGTVFTGGTNASGRAIAFKTTSGDSATQAAYQLGARVCADVNPVPQLNECVQVFATPRFDDPQANQMWVNSTGTKSCNGNDPTVCWK